MGCFTFWQSAAATGVVAVGLYAVYLFFAHIVGLCSSRDIAWTRLWVPGLIPIGLLWFSYTLLLYVGPGASIITRTITLCPSPVDQEPLDVRLGEVLVTLGEFGFGSAFYLFAVMVLSLYPDKIRWSICFAAAVVGLFRVADTPAVFSVVLGFNGAFIVDGLSAWVRHSVRRVTSTPPSTRLVPPAPLPATQPPAHIPFWRLLLVLLSAVAVLISQQRGR